MKRFQALDSFRGLFALAVVIYHAHALNSFTELRLFRNAHHFVEFFFVLSGFVLSHSYLNRLNSWQQFGQFAVARTFRLYPLHLFMLGLAIAIEVLKLVAERLGLSVGGPAFSGPRAVGEILPNALLLQSWFSAFDPLSFNYPAWSISIEYYAYLLFALIVVLLPGLARWAFVAVTGLALVALSANSTVLTHVALQGLACFFAGAITYQMYHALRHIHLKPWLGNTLEGLVVAGIVATLSLMSSPQDGLLSLLFCLAVLVFAFESGSLSTLLGKRLFTWLGTLSYSIYLTHASVLVVSCAALLAIGKLAGLPLLIELPINNKGLTVRYINSGGALLNNALVGLQVIGVLVVSTLTYRYIELPGIAAGKHWFSARSARAE